jgi:hypothetical protein
MTDRISEIRASLANVAYSGRYYPGDVEADIAYLLDRVEALEALVTSLEWSGAGSTPRSRFKGSGRCPACGAHRGDGEHDESCRLFRALATEAE